MRCYRRLLNISYKDHVTNEEVRRKIQAAIGEYDDSYPGQETKAKMVWPCLKVFWFSKDKSRKKKSSETDSIKFKISSKTPHGKKGQHKKTSP